MLTLKQPEYPVASIDTSRTAIGVEGTRNAADLCLLVYVDSLHIWLAGVSFTIDAGLGDPCKSSNQLLLERCTSSAVELSC